MGWRLMQPLLRLRTRRDLLACEKCCPMRTCCPSSPTAAATPLAHRRMTSPISNPAVKDCDH